MASAAHALTQDLTSQFAITRTGLVLNRTTNTFDSTITLKNSSGAPVLAPIDVVVGALPGGVTLANKTGDKPDGRPYVSPIAAGAQLGSGASLSFVLKFANPARVTFTNTLQVLREVVAPVNAPSLLGVVATGGTSAHLIGRVDGTPNQDVTLQVTSASTCVAGTLVSGAPAATVTVRTDSAGYFGADVAGVNPGAFVTLKTAGGSSSSLCQASTRDNDSWPKAFLLVGQSVTVQDLIDVPGKARWYKFAVTPGQRIDIRLSGLAADYDLAAFKDIGEAFASQFNPATAGPSDLLKLTAEFAPSTFSPSTFSPSTFSPSTFSPDAYSPSTFSPSTFSSSVFSPSTFSPSTFSPSTFSPSTFSPSTFSPSTFSPSTFSPSTFSPSIYTLTEIQQAFSTAQTRSIVAVSATPGLSDEATVVNTWNRTGHFYVRITGRGGAFDTGTPFTLNVTKGVTTCTGVTDTVLTPRQAVAASGIKTVLLTDSSRVALDDPLTTSPGGTLRNKLAAFAARSEIKGVVVDVGADGRVNTLKQQATKNPACPYAKNLVAEEIKGIVDSYRSNPLQYVVIVGNDDAIPFFRSPDQSVIGKESGYVPPVQSNSPSEASLRRDFVLSQDKYGSKTSISLPWNDFPVPGLAVGRLIETTEEIAGLLDAYVGADSVVSPRTSLVTGYDFLEDAATTVKTELDTGTGAPGEALITPNGVSPQAPASWKADQLRAKLFGPRHDVIFLAGHFSANSALAADFTTSVLTTELAASTTDFENSIVFSAGCHAGYNLVDGDSIPGVTLPLDWAQAFARKKATLVAGTGYQYGDTDFLEYSERLYSNFARQLRAGTVGSPVAIGEALVQAKLAYLAATPDIRGLHEKALLQATLFGLPMLGVNMPSGRGAIPGTAAAVNPTPVVAGPAATLGLETFDLGFVPSLDARTQTLTNLRGGPGITATWLTGPDGVVAKPGEPALPLSVVNVTPNDSHLVLRGIGYRGGSYVDAGPMIPFTGAATTESRGVHVAFLSPVFYPSTMWTPNYFGALAGDGGTQLLLTPVQHKVASVSAGTSTQRKHTAMNLRLFYSGNTSQAALSDAPSIIAVDALVDQTGVVFSAQVVGDPAAAIYQVWVTHTGDGTNAWTSLDLSQCVAPLPAVCGGAEDSRVWKGRLGSPPANLKYFVQAANGVGLVARNDNFGAYFGVGSILPTATTLVLFAAPASVIVGDSPNVSARLTYAGGVGLGGKIVAIGVGGATRLGTTGSDGSVSVSMPVVADPGAYVITAAFAGDDVFQPSSASSPLTINRAAVSPSVLPPGAAVAGINVSGALGGTPAGLQQVPVAFTVVGPGGATTVWSITDYLGNAIFPPPSGLPPGNYTVTGASFGGDGTYAPTTITFPTPLQVSVPKLDQSIEFDALAAKTVGDADFGVFAAASSNLAVSYGATGNCTVVGNTVHLTGVGSCTITASQAGNATYNAAQDVARSFAINPGAPVGPTVVSIARAVPSPTTANSVTYTATFSAPVNGVTSSNFAVVTSGITAASVAGVVAVPPTPPSATWTVTVNTGRGTGTLHLNLVNGTGITNVGGTPLTGAPVTGETYQIDKGGTVVGGGEGQLVTTFGSGGYAFFDDAESGGPSRIAVLSDGRILVAGNTACASIDPDDPLSPFACTLQLARYSANGVPDASFGTNGHVVTAVTTINSELSGLIANGDGTFFVTGSRYNGTAEVLFAAKFTSAGAPDTAFGVAGLATLNSLPMGFGISGAAIDTSGRIVFAGTTLDAGVEREDVFVTRLTSAGAIDTSFGTGGVAQFALSTIENRSDRGTDVAVQPDGKIVVGGRTHASGLGYDILLMRLDATGARDPLFGTNGVVITRFPGSFGTNLGRKFVLQPDGKIVIVGGVAISTAALDHCGITRFNSDGTLDASFGTGGRVLQVVGCGNVSLQSDGKLVTAGNDRIGDVFYATYLRLLQSGAPDASFGNAGVQNISIAGGTPAAFTSSGNLVTSLMREDPTDGVQKFFVVKLTTTLAGPWLNQTITFDPLPDKTFGDPDFAVSASASSGLGVSFGATGNCTVAGNTVHLTSVGSCTITASQAGDATYNAAANVARSFAINPGAPSGPTVVSIVRAVPSPTMVDSVTYTVTFSEAVNGGAPSNFSVGTSGITAAMVADVSGTGSTRTVTVHTGRGTGTLRLDLANGTGITNAGSTPLTGSFPIIGEVFEIDKGGTVIGTGEGQLLTSFGNGGYALFSDDPTSDVPGRVRVRSDGRVVAAGAIGCVAAVPTDPVSPFRCTLQLAQYTSNGAPDGTFGTNGRIVTAVTNIHPEVNLQILGDGTAFVRGIRFNGTANVPFVAMFTAAGAPTPSFGTNGVATLDALPVGFPIIGTLIDSTGRVVVVATTPDTGVGEREDIFVTRLTSSGATDSTFGTNGVAQFALSTVDDRSERGTAADIQPDGKIIIVGRTRVVSGGGYNFLVMRIDTNGVRDPSFGTNGVVTTRFSGSTTNLGRRFVLEPDGKITMIGTVAFGASNQCGVARFTSNGTPDSSFGTGGLTLVNMNVGCFSISQQSDGKFVIVGNDQLGDVSYGTFARLLQTGAPDPSFGTAGVLRISSFGSPTRVQSISSGTMITGLSIEDPADGIQKMYVVELTTTSASVALQNGSFETGDFTGWTPTGNTTFNGVQCPGPGPTVSQGNCSAFFGPIGSIGGISQTVNNLIPGDTYTLSFAVMPDGSNPSSFQALFNGTPLVSLNNPPAGPYQLYSFQVNPSTSSGTVAFNFRNDAGFFFLDAVSLTGPYFSQSITFDPIPDQAYGGFSTLSATATSGLAVTYTASGVCSVSGNVVQLTGVGSCTITAHQTGNSTWLAATSVSRTFAVNVANQVITFGPAPTGATAEQLLVTFTATSSSPAAPASALPITFTSLTPSVCTTPGSFGASVSLVAAGTCTIAANQAGNALYNPAAQATLSFAVGAAVPPGNTYLVTNNNDSGPGSLRDAIAQANAQAGANAISFLGVTGTIALTSGQIQISGPLLITGPGADQLTISGNFNSRIFSIFATDPACPAVDGPDYLVSISGLKLANARRNVANSAGGAIFTEHSLALDSMVFDNNAALSGGGVYAQLQYPGQTLTVTNSRFLENAARELLPATVGAQNGAVGGAIGFGERCANATDTPYTMPVTVTISGGEFRGNGAQPTGIHGRGGAVRSYSRADITITDTIFAENFVDAPNPPAAGKVYHGGAFEGTARTLRVERSEISENAAYDVTASDATRSGGFHIYNSAVNLQGAGDTTAAKFIDTTISSNFSSATAGAMLAFGNVALELSNVTLSDNAAAPTRTGGLLMSSGDTYPVSANNTARPRLTLVSSILANSVTGNDLVGNQTTLPTYTVNATNSLVERICATSGCSAITVVGTGNLTSVGATPGPDPLLGPLAFNGGTSRTHALLAGSPAINAGSNPLALTTDQRGAGFPRVVGGGADMGAYESGTAVPLSNFAYSSQFGSVGNGNGQFSVPVGVAIDPTTRNIVVVDSSNHRVQIFNSAGTYLSQFGSVGILNGQFSSPYMAAIDPTNHNIAVTDLGNNRVQIFNASGGYQSQFGSVGTGNGQFQNPVGVLIAPSHETGVVDHTNNRLQFFDFANAYEGQLGSPGSGDGQFNAPDGLALDTTLGNIIVADTGNNRVQVFDGEGNYLFQFGTPGNGPGQFNQPSGIAVDPTSHNIVVADYGNNRVQIFNSAGVFLSQFGVSGAGNGQFNRPYGVAIDPVSHNIVVVDQNNNRVQIFAPQ